MHAFVKAGLHVIILHKEISILNFVRVVSFVTFLTKIFFQNFEFL